ncbi:hypothetical protein EYC80_003591 [Monilinia laxa]|uniref:Mid2 domain-containing protein n=1 Tax=Monilinia laxa TaxID=61186 RepID=A0A5N6KKE3_MONLA|nr:hypothetical protein EYC80_003591 [Monilinia laxa]
MYYLGSTAGIRFCNGAITSTTEYCCDTGANGVGSFACCDNDSDIFNISPVATVLAQVPLNYVSSSTSSSSTTTSTSTSSSSISSVTASTSTTKSASNTIMTPPALETSTTPLTSASPSSHSAAIGAGVGVPCGILALGLLGFIFWRRRRAQNPDKIPKNHEAGYPAQGYQNSQGGYPVAQGYDAHSPQGGYAASEIGSGYVGGNLGEAGGIGIRDKKGYFAPVLSEMEAERTVHEMDGSDVESHGRGGS